MNASFKRGIFRISPIVLIIASLLLTTVLLRKNLHATLNYTAWHLGINLNDIEKDSYVDWIKNQNGQRENAQSGIFLNKQVGFKDAIASSNNLILGEQSTQNGEKWIEVDLSDQRLHMKEGSTTVGSFLVSSGKWYPTPTGEWRIWTKLRYTRMRGGSKALGTFYDLPNVPYTMYYYKGYGIHGAYWHNDFGTPRSHGCINMKPEEAGIVFNWASVGTRVVVHQ